jgi:hypothetical protein
MGAPKAAKSQATAVRKWVATGFEGGSPSPAQASGSGTAANKIGGSDTEEDEDAGKANAAASDAPSEPADKKDDVFGGLSIDDLSDAGQPAGPKRKLLLQTPPTIMIDPKKFKGAPVSSSSSSSSQLSRASSGPGLILILSVFLFLCCDLPTRSKININFVCV